VLLKKNTRLFLFLFTLLVSSWRIYGDFPVEGEFHAGADEGVYFSQGQTVLEHGLRGYSQILQDYLKDENLQMYPTPLRVLHIAFVSLALRVQNSITSLAGLSLFWFVGLCLICWHFIRKLWDERLAYTVCTLLAFSPLLSSMARRALMDSEVAFFAALSLFLLLYYCKEHRRSTSIALALALTCCLLVKESFQVIYPIFPACLFFAYWKDRLPKVLPLVLITVLPLLATALVYLCLFGGLNAPAEVYRILDKIAVQHPMAYVRDFGSGPWYQYFIDFFLLNPIESLGFFLGCGFFLLGTGKKDFGLYCLLAYTAWFMITHTFIPKNIRYAIGLEPVYALFASLALLEFTDRISRTSIRNLVYALVLTGMIVAEQSSYRAFFIEGRIYDPVSANLLQIVKMVPK
jgi:hypothetical protein